MVLACKSAQLFAASRRHPIAIAVESVPQCRRLNHIRFNPNIRSCTAYNLNMNLKPSSKSNNNKSNSLAFWSPKLKCTTAFNLKPSDYEEDPRTPLIQIKKWGIGLVTMVASSLLWSWAALARPIVQSSSSSSWSWSCLFSRISESGLFQCCMICFNIGLYTTAAALLIMMGSITVMAGVACIAYVPIGPIAECWQYITKQIAAQIANWEKTTVLKLQVGLLDSPGSLGSLVQVQHLNHIAKPAPKSTTNKDRSHMLTETIFALMGLSEYYISANSSVHFKKSIKEAENQFESLSLEQRETLVNVNSIPTHSLKADGLNNEYIVVAILVAVQGYHTIPTIKGSEDLKNALQKLNLITTTSQIRAVDMFWTTQTKNDRINSFNVTHT